MPLSSASVNLAGKPSRIGSTFVSVLGWLVLICGGSTALTVVLLLLAMSWPMGALAIGLPMALATLAIGIGLVQAARKLAASAQEREHATRLQALLAMTSHRGAVTARDAARALGVGVAEADAMLTALAKSEPDRIAVEVDDQGNVWYRGAAVPGEPIVQGPRVRVEDTALGAEPVDEFAPDETKKRAGA